MAHFRTEEVMFPLVEAWQSSGQTQKAFCTEKDISISVFTYWLRRYRIHGDRNQDHTPQAQEAGFVSVRLADPRAVALEVALPSGTVLRFAQVVPLSYLKALL